MALSRLLPGFEWVPSAGQFRDLASGRFVPHAQVRSALRAVKARNALEARAISQQLRDRAISLADWQRQMAALIRDSHLAGAAAARGGWHKLTPADFGRAGQIVRSEYGFLERRAQAILGGTQKLDGTILSIAAQYPLGGLETYFVFNRLEKEARGFVIVENIPTKRESCDGCRTETAKGRVPLQQLIPPGRRSPCYHHCGCFERYYNPETGEVSE